MKLTIRILGTFTLAGLGSDLALEGRKAEELISLLLLTPGQTRSREATAEALWPEASPAQSRKHLRQTLWQIHRVVDAAEPSGDRLIVTDADHVAINSWFKTWCDARELAEVVERVMLLPDTVTDAALEEALGLYRGPLLEGCYAEWCLIERERYDGLYMTALDIAAARATDCGDHHRALHRATALLTIDPAHERSHQRVMRSYHALGDRTRALRQFTRCAEALETELGVAPSAATVVIADAIREVVDDGPVASLGHDGIGWRASLSGVLTEVASLRRAVAELEHLLAQRG